MQNVPRQRLVGFSYLSTTCDITSTKSVSRSTLLLIMGLGMLLGLVNRMWVPQVSLEESKTPTKAEKKRVSNMYVFLFLLMLLIPLAAVNWVNMSNGMASYCCSTAPSFCPAAFFSSS